jgi:hypothetical protein
MPVLESLAAVETAPASRLLTREKQTLDQLVADYNSVQKLPSPAIRSLEPTHRDHGISSLDRRWVRRVGLI